MFELIPLNFCAEAEATKHTQAMSKKDVLSISNVFLRCFRKHETKEKFFYEASFVATIKLGLCHSLVRSDVYSAYLTVSIKTFI